jgi:hypothetical protein
LDRGEKVHGDVDSIQKAHVLCGVFARVKVAVLALTVVFWLSVVVFIGWITLYAWNDALIVGQLGEKGGRWSEPISPDQ